MKKKFKGLICCIKNIFKINPYKNWKFLLSIFFILIFILILFSLFLIYKIKKGQIFQVTIEQIDKKSLLDENLLKKTTEYQNRKIEKLNSINSSLIYKDPSL